MINIDGSTYEILHIHLKVDAMYNIHNLYSHITPIIFPPLTTLEIRAKDSNTIPARIFHFEYTMSGILGNGEIDNLIQFLIKNDIEKSFEFNGNTYKLGTISVEVITMEDVYNEVNKLIP